MQTALDRAIAKIEADAAAREAVLNRIIADARYLSLAHAAAEAPLKVDGHFGVPAIIAKNATAGHWRKLRAKALAHARKCQIEGLPKAALAYLTHAAQCRRSEMAFRAAERRAAMGVAA